MSDDAPRRWAEPEAVLTRHGTVVAAEAGAIACAPHILAVLRV